VKSASNISSIGPCLLLLTPFLRLNGQSAPGAPPPGPLITYVDAQPLLADLNNDGAVIVRILVRNVGLEMGRPKFCTFYKESAECVNNVEIVEHSDSLAAQQVAQIVLHISGIRPPFSGYLEMLTCTTDEKIVGRSFRQLKVSAPFFPTIAWVPIGVGLLAGILLFIYSALAFWRAAPPIPLSAKMGSPTWDFSRSWASNITIAGSLLSVMLTASTWSELSQYVSKIGYALLNVFFVLLILAAPFVFNLVREPVVSNVAGTDGSKIQYQGYVWCFLVASGITVWAVTGQMITLIILVDEFSIPGLNSFGPVRLIETIILLLTLGLVIYGAMTVFWTARGQEIAQRPPVAQTYGATDVREVPVPLSTTLPTWPLL
jgi:hypothetical protein